MKKNLLTAAAAVLFLIFLGLGILTGRRLIGSPTPTPEPAFLVEEPAPIQPQTSETVTLAPAALEPAGEMVLVLFTSRREGSHSLEGVWLLSTDRSENRGNFLPVLPSQAGDGPVRDQILRAAYSLAGDNQPGANFFRVLKERNLSWDGYLVVTEDKMAELAAASGDHFELPGGKAAVLRYDPGGRDQVRLSQAEVLEAACGLLNQGEFSPQVQQAAADLLDQPGLNATSAAGLTWAPAGGEFGAAVECLFPTLGATSR